MAETPNSLQLLERGVLLEGASDLNSLSIADFGALVRKAEGKWKPKE